MTTQEAIFKSIETIVFGVIVVFILLAATDNLDLFKRKKKHEKFIRKNEARAIGKVKQGSSKISNHL